MSPSAWRLLRVALRPLVRLFYRPTVIGARNIPATGPALLLSNHVSFIDGILIGFALERPPRFLIWRKFYDHYLFGPIVRALGAIPISETDTHDAMLASIERVIAELKRGELVCLFPEGGMTRTGHVRAFKRGFEIIARRAKAPIIPVYLDGIWGSLFSYEGGKYFFKTPQWIRRGGRFPRPITVAFGKPLPPDSTRSTVKAAVLELGSDAFEMRKHYQRPLHVQFWRSARSTSWAKLCMADSTGRELAWGRSLAASLMLARWIERHCSNQKMLGIMLPASVGATLLNVASLIAGKIPVNLNFTVSKDSLAFAIRACELKTVFTSRALIQRLKIEESPQFHYIEDILRAIPARERTICYLLALLTPNRLAERWLMRPSKIDDIATIIFTSGATGEPKGVILSHHNVVSNIESFSEVLQFGPQDTMMCVLPPFHAFGFTAALWTPLLQRMPVIFHPAPLEAKAVGEMVAKYRATIIPGTSAFFSIYTRACEPEQFKSLRLAVAGAQKLAPSVAEAFRKKFGLAITEGYGCTELSPVAAVNVPDVSDGPVTQVGRREGAVGYPLPGLSVKVLDRETLEPVKEGESGIVLIRGSNVMLRYMDDSHATAAAKRDGPDPPEPGLKRVDWYITGDIGSLDEDGFLYIQDRVSRFSKIGGEMVPHGAIENALSSATGNANSFAVVNLPDESRGEKLVVLYSGDEIDSTSLLRKAAEAGLPNLWLPSPKEFHRVESLPLLASGKLDLAAARTLAGNLTRSKAGH